MSHITWQNRVAHQSSDHRGTPLKLGAWARHRSGHSEAYAGYGTTAPADTAKGAATSGLDAAPALTPFDGGVYNERAASPRGWRALEGGGG